MPESLPEHCYYSAEFGQFIDDAKNPHKIAYLMNKARKANGDKYNENEVASWPSSISALHRLFNDPGRHGIELSSNAHIILEYRLDNHKRIDALLCGKDPNGNDSASIIEMKNWRLPNPPKFDIRRSNVSPDLLTMLIKGKEKMIHHPSDQVAGYVNRLLHLQKLRFDDFHKLNLIGSVYFYTMSDWPRGWESILKDSIFKPNLSRYSLYNRDKEHKLFDHTIQEINYGSGKEAENIFKEIRIRSNHKEK